LSCLGNLHSLILVRTGFVSLKCKMIILILYDFIHGRVLYYEYISYRKEKVGVKAVVLKTK
jgi:hypothetical protein